MSSNSSWVAWQLVRYVEEEKKGIEPGTTLSMRDALPLSYAAGQLEESSTPTRSPYIGHGRTTSKAHK